MYENYQEYLNWLSAYLEKYFKDQSPYIHCKEGCSFCCEKGEYPFSRLEFEYVSLGIKFLPVEVQNQIKQQVEIIKEAKDSFKKTNEGEKFLHSCPFLIDKKCSVYDYRGLICRSHGLLYFDIDKNGEEQFRIPACVHRGLNYSEVYDEKLQMISSKKFIDSGIVVEPLSYNVGIDFLQDNEKTRELNLDFGESKALIDWFY
jgi:Fe-S-cluster containining protein